ncbi:hypothetical protein MTR67_026974 [Solanum verrucosum]|uniref:Uncharacterized protein n=1 Tax=Solanum verrucosum TaxID=315347 RepID=A0AAF0R8S3_SOLVR|nr:hypothetical protein MTR67_026974 [Solanum verrucosum]
MQIFRSCRCNLQSPPMNRSLIYGPCCGFKFSASRSRLDRFPISSSVESVDIEEPSEQKSEKACVGENNEEEDVNGQEEIGALGCYGKCFWIDLVFTIIAATTQNLTIKIQQQAWDEGFLFTVVYVSCQVGIMKKLWESLRNHADHHPIPWMVEGDFNFRFQSHCLYLVNGRTDEACIFIRLDRALRNQRLLDEFLVIYAKHLIKRWYDHAPLELWFSQNSRGYDQTLESDSEPDGFTEVFYQSCWDIIKGDVIAVVQHFFRGETLPRFVTQKNLELLSKKDQVNTFSDVRPISLSNFINKVFSRVVHDKKSMKVMIRILKDCESSKGISNFWYDNLTRLGALYHILPDIEEKEIEVKRSRYVAILWNYGQQKLDAGAISDSEAPQRHNMPHIVRDGCETIEI